jgi:ATP-dependent Clp protease adaptor protein ClpS
MMMPYADWRLLLPRQSAAQRDEPFVRLSDGDLSTGVVVRSRPKNPSMYKVIMLNDDYTPMKFVVMILEQFFNKNHEEASQIMLHVHQKRVGVCGVYSYEIGETKAIEVMNFAWQHQHPLLCILEET